MKHVHLFYDHEQKEIILAGVDQRPISYYSPNDPRTAIQALISETAIDLANQEEMSVRIKEEDDKDKRW